MHALPLPGVRTAEEAALRLGDRPGLAWLDGDGRGAEGRWSFVGTEPRTRVRVDGGDPHPLRALDLPREGRDVPADAAGAPTPGQVPRWIGWVAYDACGSGRATRLDRAPNARVVSFGRYDALLAFDHATGAAFVVGDDRDACERLAATLDAAAPRLPRARVDRIVASDSRAHLAAIETALQHIARGEVYQVNLARRWKGELRGDPLALFLAMRAASPVPLGCYFDDSERAVLARTMERFLRWDRDEAALFTRPIKGTIGRQGECDDAEAAELRADPKECAEHAMIVDLMRNDLGRVARVGTVEVSDLMRVEPYAGLHHLVSTVRCRTRADATPGAILEATFPPGSVTGTPKLRAIEIIEGLEPCARGVYTGAVGFIDRAGGVSLAVAIRTAVVGRGEVEYWAGGGIVEASRPERELAETELKARVFLDAARSLATDAEGALSPPPLLR